MFGNQFDISVKMVGENTNPVLLYAVETCLQLTLAELNENLREIYVEAVKKIYGSHVRQIILYGSYARGDFRPDSDVDIMILVDISDLELKAYAQQLSYMTYDFNMDHDTDIKLIAKSEAHFNKWIVNYPFYSNIHKEGVVLYGAA